MTDTASSADQPQGSGGTPAKERADWPQVLVIVLASLLFGLGLASIAGRQAVSGPAGLAAVAQTEIDAAILSMDASAGAKAGEDARQCKAPLAFVTIKSEPGTAAETVRIRSGGYVSPPLVLSGEPRRIAVPFPAPYPAGKGELVVEGITSKVTLWLTPAVTLSSQAGVNRIPVVWSTANPCPR